MNAYPECYVNEIVETQGKLFELVADSPSVDFDDFIEKLHGNQNSQLFGQGRRLP